MRCVYAFLRIRNSVVFALKCDVQTYVMCGNLCASARVSRNFVLVLWKSCFAFRNSRCALTEHADREACYNCAKIVQNRIERLATQRPIWMEWNHPYGRNEIHARGA